MVKKIKDLKTSLLQIEVVAWISLIISIGCLIFYIPKVALFPVFSCIFLSLSIFDICIAIGNIITVIVIRINYKEKKSENFLKRRNIDSSYDFFKIFIIMSINTICLILLLLIFMLF